MGRETHFAEYFWQLFLHSKWRREALSRCRESFCEQKAFICIWARAGAGAMIRGRLAAEVGGTSGRRDPEARPPWGGWAWNSHKSGIASLREFTYGVATQNKRRDLWCVKGGIAPVPLIALITSNQIHRNGFSILFKHFPKCRLKTPVCTSSLFSLRMLYCKPSIWIVAKTAVIKRDSYAQAPHQQILGIRVEKTMTFTAQPERSSVWTRRCI